MPIGKWPEGWQAVGKRSPVLDAVMKSAASGRWRRKNRFQFAGLSPGVAAGTGHGPSRLNGRLEAHSASISLSNRGNSIQHELIHLPHGMLMNIKSTPKF
jgi:hypothetical protein